ncbi:uncharacterized protein [Atheta coriaria]|uniref:uncharacterized protein n=1 Tax=Dalotia coriaria TaxID=877792 RepID=UPI0031F37E93
MFENINEFRDAPEILQNVIKFKDIPTYLGTMDVYKILTRRMANIVIFLIQMLQTDYKLKKTIKPEILLVIQRGLDIYVHGDENDPNRVLFHQNIQQHQIDLLFLLKALIQSLQSNFMRHSTIKMLFRYLARVTDCTCYNVNSFYKSTIYDVIKYWLQCSGEQIDAKTLQKLIEIIIKDITPSKATLVLQINVNSRRPSRHE